jgi:peptidoglycan hydrolase-like protein with peptidoglycan-binding domain
VLGEPTRRAIRHFQADHGDAPTGQISASLYIRLSKLRRPAEPTAIFSAIHYHTQRVQTGRGLPVP